MLPITQEQLLTLLVRLVSVTVGSVGFAMMFRTPPKKLPAATLGCMLTYIAYEMTLLLGGGIMSASFFAAAVMALFSEVFARIMRTPTILFLLSCLITIVPGNALYNAMQSLLVYDRETLISNAVTVFETVLGISVGLGVASIAIGIVLQVIKAVKAHNNE